MPLLIIGKPGTSKNLALSLLLNQMKGEGSENDFLLQFPALQAFYLQCSASTSSSVIKDTFKVAREFQVPQTKQELTF